MDLVYIDAEAHGLEPLTSEGNIALKFIAIGSLLVVGNARSHACMARKALFDANGGVPPKKDAEGVRALTAKYPITGLGIIMRSGEVMFRSYPELNIRTPGNMTRRTITSQLADFCGTPIVDQPTAAEWCFWLALASGTVMLFGLLVMSWYVYFAGMAVAIVFQILGHHFQAKDEWLSPPF